MTRFSKYHIFTDFDGTITDKDTLFIVLDRFGAKAWQKIEDEVTAGRLTDKQALQKEFDLVNATLEEAIEFLDSSVQIDATFIPFVRWCRKQQMPVTILSGGFDLFIHQVLSKSKFLGTAPFFSNSVKIENNRWQVIPSNLPKIKNRCNFCKTHHLQEARNGGKTVIYIGDGNTDRCPAEFADLVFAKDILAEYLEMKTIPFYKYENFDDIQKKLETF